MGRKTLLICFILESADCPFSRKSAGFPGIGGILLKAFREKKLVCKGAGDRPPSRKVRKTRLDEAGHHLAHSRHQDVVVRYPNE